MKMHMIRITASAALLLAAIAHAPAADVKSWGPGADDATFQAMLKSSFKEKGIATLARLTQDETQAFCSDPAFANGKEGEKRRSEIEAQNLASVKWPGDGKWLGDTPNGGNCYNCHQLAKSEIAFGTIGPSLYNYGKLRGTSDEVLRATWAKIYNAKATNACSNMPRAGHMGILTELQIKDLMALLLDPNSPVNQ